VYLVVVGWNLPPPDISIMALDATIAACVFYRRAVGVALVANQVRDDVRFTLARFENVQSSPEMEQAGIDSLDLRLRVYFLFFSKTWKKQVAKLNGFKRPDIVIVEGPTPLSALVKDMAIPLTAVPEITYPDVPTLPSSDSMFNVYRTTGIAWVPDNASSTTGGGSSKTCWTSTAFRPTRRTESVRDCECMRRRT
jgi:hypothetical protein